MQKRPRLYYIPGMISLIVLPIIGYYFLFHSIKEERSIELVYPSKYDPEKKSEFRFDTTFLSNPRCKRHYLDIVIDGNEKENKIKLDFLQIRLKELLDYNDTINGVHILFTDSARYESLIKSLDICNELGFFRFALFENNLWMLQFNGDKATIKQLKKPIETHCLIEIFGPIKHDNDSKYINDCLDMVKNNWVIFISLLLLSCFSIHKVFKIRR